MNHVFCYLSRWGGPGISTAALFLPSLNLQSMDGPSWLPLWMIMWGLRPVSFLIMGRLSRVLPCHSPKSCGHALLKWSWIMSKKLAHKATSVRRPLLPGWPTKPAHSFGLPPWLGLVAKLRYDVLSDWLGIISDFAITQDCQLWVKGI